MSTASPHCLPRPGPLRRSAPCRGCAGKRGGADGSGGDVGRARVPDGGRCREPGMLPLETAIAAAKEARAWPFEEARRILARLEGNRSATDKAVLFETGYGP